MNKKILWISLIVMCLVLIAVSVSYWLVNKEPKICDPYLNIESVIASGKIDSCDCLNEEVKIKSCQIILKDMIIYNQIPKTFDPTLCSQIIATSTKENCLNLIQDRNNFIEQHKGQSLPDSIIN